MDFSLSFIQGSIVVMIIGYIIALAFQLYMLYLNYKQSRVNNQMSELLAEVKEIRKEMTKHTAKPKKKTTRKKK